MIMVILCDPIAILLVDQPHCRCEGVRNDASTDGSACALSAIALCRTLSGDFASWKVAGREQGRANRRGQDKARKVRAVGRDGQHRRIPAIRQTLRNIERTLRCSGTCYRRSTFDTP
jgi:hypothetical protein